MYISYTMCSCAFLFSPMEHVNACTRKLAHVSKYNSHGKRTKKPNKNKETHVPWIHRTLNHSPSICVSVGSVDKEDKKKRGEGGNTISSRRNGNLRYNDNRWSTVRKHEINQRQGCLSLNTQVDSFQCRDETPWSDCIITRLQNPASSLAMPPPSFFLPFILSPVWVSSEGRQWMPFKSSERNISTWVVSDTT